MRPSPIVLLFPVALIGLLGLPSTAGATITTLDVPQLWQHRDTDYVWCDLCPGFGPHDPNDAPIPPWGNGCHHCAAYCAPASVLMIRQYRGLPGCPCCQECFYNKYKYMDGEIPNDFWFTTHGIGMWDEEVLAAFRDALGDLHVFGGGGAGDPIHPMTAWVLRQLICMGTPVLWLDRDGHPREYMPPEVYYEMVARGEGHAKVLAGYDDMNTYCQTADDIVLVFDPWSSPGDCPYPKSPYWVPVDAVVTSDVNDLFLADQVGGIAISETDMAQSPTAWSNGRHLVRDESDGSYNVVFASGGQIFFSKSLRPHVQGSWTEPIRISMGELPLYARDPALALSPNPQGYSPLHAVWSQGMMPENPGDLYYSESVDGGQTWSFPEMIYLSPWEDSHHPSLDVDGRGSLHLVWDETGLEWGREIFYSTRGVAGDTWSEPLNISETPAFDSSFPALATSYDGTEWDDPPTPARTLHVAWVETDRQHPIPISTIVYRMWDSVGQWIPPLQLPPENVAGAIGGTSPSIIVGPDRVPQVVWTSSQEEPDAVPTTPSDIYYNVRQGNAWQIPWRVTQSGGAEPTAAICPTLAFANGPFCSCLHATWEEWNLGNETCDVWVAMRSGMTMVWGDYTRVTYDGRSVRRFPTLAYKNGTDFTKAYDLVWTDATLHFSYYVRFLGTSRANPEAASADPPEVARAAPLHAWPNPFRGCIDFAGSAATQDQFLQIFDVSGRQVRRLFGVGGNPRWTWDGRDADGRPLPQGIYLVRVPDTRSEKIRVVLLR